MELNRIQDISIYYWLQEKVPGIVTVVDGFPTEDLELPTVSITPLELRGLPFELGGCEQDRFFWRIDIFAKNVAQRDELAYMIFDELKQNIPVYDYNVGFPPPVPPRLGTLLVEKRFVQPVHVFRELVEKLYWRSGITFFTTYQVL